MSEPMVERAREAGHRIRELRALCVQRTAHVWAWRGAKTQSTGNRLEPRYVRGRRQPGERQTGVRSEGFHFLWGVGGANRAFYHRAVKQKAHTGSSEINVFYFLQRQEIRAEQ